MGFDEIIYRNKTSTVKDPKDGERAEVEIACIVTRLFDYMVDTGITYGYVTAGEAFLFAYFNPHNVEILFYECVIPNAAVEISQDLTKTAVGLGASYTYLARRGPVLDRDWGMARRDKLSGWSVDDVAMGQISLSPEATIKLSPPYQGRAKPSNDGSERSMRSKIKAATSCRTDQSKEARRHERDDEDDARQGRWALRIRCPNGRRTSSSMVTGSQATKSESNQASSGSNPKGRSGDRRAYCTQACLGGLVRGLLLDLRCPNVEAHRMALPPSQPKHALDRQGLQRLVEQQLRNHRNDELFGPLDRGGWAGALFYVTLASHGYTFFAKGTVQELITVLHHEARIYDGLKEIQGRSVPVYLGSIDLLRPYWRTCSIAIVHIIMLSWGGEEAWCCDDIVDWLRFVREEGTDGEGRWSVRG